MSNSIFLFLLQFLIINIKIKKEKSESKRNQYKLIFFEKFYTNQIILYLYIFHHYKL